MMSSNYWSTILKGNIEQNYSFLLPLLLGGASFLIVFGPRVLDPTNIGWLSHGDPAQHYLGWLFFSNSSWSFPIGENPKYGLELSSAIVFSDSIPLLAFLFKVASFCLTRPFQYFGIWLLGCFLLQAWFSWSLIGLITKDVSIRLLGAGFFVFAPPMISRGAGHLALVGHFLLLAALFQVFRPRPIKPMLSWGVLLAVSALVHAYLFAMVAAIWVAGLAERVAHSRDLKEGVVEFGTLSILLCLVCWQAGYFDVGSGVSSFGFGYYRLNLLSLINAYNWSYIVPSIPVGPGDYEGFNYLGLGVILLLICAIVIYVCSDVALAKNIISFPFLFTMLVISTLFSLSNKIGFGPFTLLEYPYHGSRIANVFRSSGRMFWPVFYAIIFLIIFVIVRGAPKRATIFLFGVALTVQVADTSAGWRSIRASLMAEPRSTWTTSMISPFWECAASKYRNVRWIPPENRSPEWQEIALFAGAHGLATDAVDLARVSAADLLSARQKAETEIETGVYATDSLYVFDETTFGLAAKNVDQASNFVAHLDGLNVIAPGGADCAH